MLGFPKKEAHNLKGTIQRAFCFFVFGIPVHHQLLKTTQTHVHHISDAIQPSYPLSSPSPPAFNLSQHQDLFQ